MQFASILPFGVYKCVQRKDLFGVFQSYKEGFLLFCFFFLSSKESIIWLITRVTKNLLYFYLNQYITFPQTVRFENIIL